MDCDRNESSPWFHHYYNLKVYLFLFPISNKVVNMADIPDVMEPVDFYKSNSIRNYDAMLELLERHWDKKVGTDSRAAQDNKSTEWFLLSNAHLWWELTEDVLSASPATSQVAQIASIYFFQYWELKSQGQGIGKVGSIQGEIFSSSNTTLCHWKLLYL